MNQTEYNRMAKIFNYVYSTPPNTVEREKRLAEIGEEDASELWDFYLGICSGRIKAPEVAGKEREMSIASGRERIANYEDFLTASRNGRYDLLCEFKRSNPETYACYAEQMGASLGHKKPKKTRDVERLVEEKKKRSEILAIQDTMERHKAIYENMALFRR